MGVARGRLHNTCGCENIRFCNMLAQCIQRGKVKGGPDACTYDRWQCTAPKLFQGIRTCENLAKCSAEGG